MRKIVIILFFQIFIYNFSFSDISEQLSRLDNLYKSGSITNEEFIKAKSIILKIDVNKKKQKEVYNKNIIKINNFKDSKMSFERMEMLFGDYRIYTHRPGGIKIKRLSNNKQLAVFSDKFKIKYYNDGEELFDFILDENKENITVKFKNIELFNWQGTYVPKHKAYFFQILTSNNEPFHYYIKLKNGRNSVALNIHEFNKKIDKAVAKVKVMLAAKYNITLEQIELILKKKKLAKNKELEKIIGNKKEEVLREASEKALQVSINNELTKELENTIGQAMSNEFVTAIETASGQAIEQALEDELASAIDEAIADAVTQGISEAAAQAGIKAFLEVLAAGGSEQEAWDAGCAAAGEDPGC